jgi:hypothetical protein
MDALRTIAGRFGLLLFAVLVLVLAGLEVVASHRVLVGGTRLQPVERGAWSEQLQAANHAIAERNIATADRELQSAYLAALGSRRWEGMIAYGDAAARVAEIASVRPPWVEKAHQAYLIALFRARDAGSVDGVLRAAEGFHRLHDRDVADLALRVAERMTRVKGETKRLVELAARLDESRVAVEPALEIR